MNNVNTHCMCNYDYEKYLISVLTNLFYLQTQINNVKWDMKQKIKIFITMDFLVFEWHDKTNTVLFFLEKLFSSSNKVIFFYCKTKM